jgi:hypothetical protein
MLATLNARFDFSSMQSLNFMDQVKSSSSAHSKLFCQKSGVVRPRQVEAMSYYDDDPRGPPTPRYSGASDPRADRRAAPPPPDPYTASGDPCTSTLAPTPLLLRVHLRLISLQQLLTSPSPLHSRNKQLFDRRTRSSSLWLRASPVPPRRARRGQRIPRAYLQLARSVDSLR